MRSPLISCIMPTGGRKWFIPEAIRLFLLQDYPNKELIIVYDKEDDLPPDLFTDTKVRLVKSADSSIGAKRNLGCAHARGELIAQWDDDDVYHPARLSAQALPIINGEADITGLNNFLFYEHDEGVYWYCPPRFFSLLFAESVGGGTLVFKKSCWGTYNPYPAISLREDAEFMLGAITKGSRLVRIDGSQLFIYRRHTRNSWKFSPAFQLRRPLWQPAARPGWISSIPVIGYPLVSCIMPTADRRVFAEKSILQFLLQDYPNRELIILDDGTQPLTVPFHPSIRYIYNPYRKNIGQKRNAACQVSSGEIIMHWDDDDWYSPVWITKQVEWMLKQNAGICGLKEMLFYNEAKRQAWKYTYPATGRPWVGGATMAYRKSLWEENPFREVQVGEDNWFVWESSGKVIPHPYITGFISTIHPGNTSIKNVNQSRWSPVLSHHIHDAYINNTALDLQV